MAYTTAGFRRKLYYPKSEATLPTTSKRIITAIMQEINDTPPWAYTYRERPGDLLEIRASELEAILSAHLEALRLDAPQGSAWQS